MLYPEVKRKYSIPGTIHGGFGRTRTLMVLIEAVGSAEVFSKDML